MNKASQSILVVEDEALLLITIADELRDAGFTVYEATTADQAIKLLEAHADISILFTDIDMPGSMDGLKLSLAVRNRWPPVKIIVTSGKQEPDAGMMPSDSVFMAKPYLSAKLVANIQRLMG